MGMLLRRHRGRNDETTATTEASAESEPLKRPSASASKADWAAYAVQEGHDVEGLKRDEIVALFPTE